MKFSRSMWKLGIASSLAMAMLSVSRPAVAQTLGLGVVEKGKDEPPRYYGLHFDLSIYDGSGLNSVGQNYRNDLNFYFEPSWDIGKTFGALRNTRWKGLQLAARFVVSANLSGTDESAFSGNTHAGPQGTCSNITPTSNGGVVDPGSVGYCNPATANRRADYSDFWLTLRAPSLYKWSNPEYSFSLSPSVRAVFPTSMESRYATLIAAVTPSIGMTHSFWKHRLHAGFSFGVTKNFHKQSTTQLQTDGQGNVSTTGGNPYDGALSSGLSNFYADPSRQASFGGLNTNFALLSIVSGGVTFNDKWSFDALYVVSNAYPYSQDCTQQVQGYSVDLCSTGTAVASASGSELWRPGRRDTQTFWASLNYQPWEWIGFSLSWINSAPMWKPDSTYRQAIISTDYNAFTTISFGTSISIDHFAEMLEKRNKKKQADPVAKSNAVSFQ